MDSIRLFDAHCHLQDDRIFGNVDAVLLRARQAGVRAMMCCGSGEDDWENVRALSKREGVFVSYGLHPWYVDARSGAWFEKLGALLENAPEAGVGEIGLDHALEDANREIQDEIFISQLRLARDLDRPVTLHCRKAFGRFMEILKDEGGVASGGIVHSYSGPKDLVPQLEHWGLSISFSGSITRSSNKRGHEALKAVSPDRLLIETDSPDICPVQIPPGTPNEPAHLVCVLETITQLTGESPETVARRTWENACRVFLK